MWGGGGGIAHARPANCPSKGPTGKRGARVASRQSQEELASLQATLEASGLTSAGELKELAKSQRGQAPCL